MGSQDSFFEALGGETPIGFFTHSTTISHGVDVQGNQVGVKGTCQGPVGDGVQGFGSGNFSGVPGELIRCKFPRNVTLSYCNRLTREAQFHVLECH
jgi:hypothetical protein